MSLLLLLVGCGTGEPAFLERDVPLGKLLVNNPPLPAKWHQTLPPKGQQPGLREIRWVMTRPSFRMDEGLSEHCGQQGEEIVRVWNDRGEIGNQPELLHFVCKQPSASVARDRYESMGAADVAGEDYINVDLHLPPRYLEPPLWTPKLVQAQEGELLCMAGKADAVCSAWLYRGLYGRYLVLLIFRASGGGLEFAEFLPLVRAVDQATMSELRG